MRVLFVGGGRRVSLAERFIKHGFQVFSYETDANCPIAKVATVIVGKKWSDVDVATHILNIMAGYQIDLAIPLQDHATTILSRIKQEALSLGTKIPTANEEVNAICLNKKLFENKLQNWEHYPKMIEDQDVIIKPAFGFNSKGIKKILFKEYENYYQDHPDLIAQRLIKDGFEISVDAYFNKYGKMIDGVPRRRLEVQGGEVSKSITLDRDAYNVLSLTKQVGEEIGVVGPVCVQFITDQNNYPFIMEINARFGGGVILSLEAGLDIVGLIKQEYLDEIECVPTEYDWKSNFGMVRYFQEHFYVG